MLSAKKLAPGKSGQLQVKLSTERFSGPIEKRVVLTTNDPGNPTVTLFIKAIVEPEIKKSESSIYFGLVPAGKEATKELILTITPIKPIRITGVVSEDPNVAVRLEPVGGSNGKKVKLIATRRANVNATGKFHVGKIVVKTDSLRTPEITIQESGLIGATD